MVGEQLQGDGKDDRRDLVLDRGDIEDLDPVTALHLRPGIGKHDQLPATCPHLLEVGLQLFQQFVVGRHHDYRHVGIHQRQRTMLQFARRIGLGMDIGDLLQLERPFHGHRILRPPAEEQGVVLVGKLLGQSFDDGIEAKHLFDASRQALQLPHQSRLFLPGHTVTPPEGDHQQHQCHQLGSERLGGGDTDLGAGTGHQGKVGLPHQRAFRHVADGQRLAETEPLGLLQSGQGIGGLPRLGDGHHQ